MPDKLNGAIALVMGAEGEGMRRLTREHCDQLISIPMAGSVSSLNVSVATGVTLFEAVRQRADVLASIRNGEYLFKRPEPAYEVELDVFRKTR